MIWRTTVSWLVVCVTALAGDPKPQRPLVDKEALRGSGLARYWRAQLPMATGDQLERVELLDDTLYAVTDMGSVFAVTADTGLIRWGRKITEPDYVIYSPTHIRNARGTGPVIIPTTTDVRIYDRYSGDLLEQFSPPFAVSGSVLGSRGLLFMGSGEGKVYSFQLNPREGQAPFKRWEVMAGGPVTAALVLFGEDGLVFASQSGSVFFCRASDKTLQWSVRTAGAITGDPAIDEDGVYIASADRSLYKFHIGTGRTLWRHQFPSPLDRGPMVIGDTVYQTCNRAGLVALDVDTGKERWRYEAADELVAHTTRGDVVYTVDRRLVILDHEDGRVLHELAVPAVTGVVSNARTPAAYLFNGDGRLLSVRLHDVPYLRRQQLIAAQRGLNRPPQSSDGARGDAQATRAGNTRNTSNDPFRSRRDGGR